ncbi:glutathione hydrolase 1-like isoform X2 [Magnolia sinica]|uniref:glutathione hydrolase 1-like isoform X2 n=1 Tax=Magnolia sinica TaxID=86752 RepID=UPI0026583B90|nr:glutathione hydrolase 1-like isoform X2 [Magnolia sinica]
MSALLMLWPTIALIVLLSLPNSSLSSLNDLITNRREQIVAKNGAVATDDGRCSRIGRDVLREGGHAVDAAIAATFCLGVVSPASSGIGGGAFMLVRSAAGISEAFDMRETAPLLASQNMYANNATLKASGALSVAVPAELAGLHEAWNRHGRLPWKRLVMPAAYLARRGFRVSPYLHFQMVRTEAGILADEGLKEIFTSNKKLLKTGDVCRNKKLGRTLEAISIHGPAAFYNGSIGVKLVRDVRKAGGVLTMKDLEMYRVKVKEPISADILGLKILGMPPPSSGGAGMILILNILSRYGVPSGVSGSLGLHREIEALKHMIAVRMNLGDPDFVNVSKVLSDMLSPKFAEELKATIFDNMTFNPPYYGGKWNQIHDHGTSHLCIVDGERNAVSMTSTINAYFGARFLSPSTGIVLNNEMDDFSIPGNGLANNPPPAPANFVRPSKRPLSSMTPTIIVKDGQLKAVLGASGGAMIIAGTIEVFLNHFAKGMDPLSSVMGPRVYHQLIPNVVQYENWTTVSGDHFEVPDEMRAALRKKGHVLQSLSGGTICQFIVHNIESLKAVGGVISGELTAISDPRKGGFPAGF